MRVAQLFCRPLEMPINFPEGSAKIYVAIVPCAFSAKNPLFLFWQELLADPLQPFGGPPVGNHWIMLKQSCKSGRAFRVGFGPNSGPV